MTTITSNRPDEMDYAELIVFGETNWFYTEDIPEKYRLIHQGEFSMVNISIPPDTLNKELYITNMVNNLAIELMIDSEY